MVHTSGELLWSYTSAGTKHVRLVSVGISLAHDGSCILVPGKLRGRVAAVAVDGHLRWLGSRDMAMVDSVVPLVLGRYGCGGTQPCRRFLRYVMT